MHVSHCLGDLIEELEGFSLVELEFTVLVVEEVAFLCVFHDQIDHVLVEDSVPELDDVGMVEERVEVDLPLDEPKFVVSFDVLEIDLREYEGTILMA